MNMPNFLVIGAEKAGTTALYHVLRQHPQIYMSPVKEPCFFAFENHRMDYVGPGDSWINNNAVTHLSDYQTLFNGCKDEVAAGEASTYYLMLSAQTTDAISYYVPDMKLIVILRHPVDRAYSAFTAMISYGRESLRDFNIALTAGDHRWRNHWEPAWRYLENGCYSTHIQQYLKYFSREQIRFYLYEEWNQKPMTVLRDICAFLGVNSDLIPGTRTRHNISNHPRNDRVFQFLTSPNQLKEIGKSLIPQKIRRRVKRYIIARNWTNPPPLDGQTRSRLLQHFREDILRLQDILNRDLHTWLNS